jgi:hypothetical protein
VSGLRDKGESTISRHNAELEELGYIVRERRVDSSSLTYILDYEHSPRLIALAEEILGARLKNETSDVSKMRHSSSQKRDVEEEQVEEQPVEEQSSAGADDDHPVEAGDGYEYVPAGDEFARPKLPIVQFLAECGRNIGSENQIARLDSKVMNPSGEDYPSPNWLYRHAAFFPDYIRDKVAWAQGRKGDGKRKPNQSLVSAICNYRAPGTGWLAFEEKQRLSARGNGDILPDEEDEYDKIYREAGYYD